MNRLKAWQAAVLAAIAVVIAVGVIWRYAAMSAEGVPVPPPYSGPPPAAGSGQTGAGTGQTGAGTGQKEAIPMPPNSFPGAPPGAGANSPR